MDRRSKFVSFKSEQINWHTQKRIYKLRRQLIQLSLLSSNKASSGVRGRDLVSIFEKGHFKIRKYSENSNQNGKGSETIEL